MSADICRCDRPTRWAGTAACRTCAGIIPADASVGPPADLIARAADLTRQVDAAEIAEARAALAAGHHDRVATEEAAQRAALAALRDDYSASLAGQPDPSVCSTEGCPGDGRYVPPGNGHRSGCTHLASLRQPATDPDVEPLATIIRDTTKRHTITPVVPGIYAHGATEHDLARAVLAAGYRPPTVAAEETQANPLPPMTLGPAQRAMLAATTAKRLTAARASLSALLAHYDGRALTAGELREGNPLDLAMRALDQAADDLAEHRNAADENARQAAARRHA